MHGAPCRIPQPTPVNDLHIMEGVFPHLSIYQTTKRGGIPWMSLFYLHMPVRVRMLDGE